MDIKIILVPEFSELTKQYRSYSTIIMQTKENRVAEISAQYHEFIDIFEAKNKNLEKLLDHGPHDLKINLEPGATVPSSRHYSTSPEEQETLNRYLVENLPKYFIRPCSSLSGAPVLFIHKKNEESRLCVNYRGLNFGKG